MMINWRKFWCQRGLFNQLLRPFSVVFRILGLVRRYYYQCRPPIPFRVPVIVVGNLSVGGSGKSPLVMYCAALLQAQGWKPGIVSRGYGGRSTHYPVRVTEASEPTVVGDEPLMLVRRLHCPVMVDPDRARAVNELLNQTQCDVVLSDDGLQHYALHRDIEIVVVHPQEGFGNGYCLPAGPLREPVTRLASVDFILADKTEAPKTYAVQRAITQWINVNDPTAKLPANAFEGVMVHAVAGIASPESFFESCHRLRIRFQMHAYPDHAVYQRDMVYFEDGFPVLMTEKDAVKCTNLVSDHTWYAQQSIIVDPLFDERLLSMLHNLCTMTP